MPYHYKHEATFGANAAKSQRYIYKEVSITMKKILAIAFCLIIAVAACFGLVACGDTDDIGGGQTPPARNDDAWFSDQELADRGLSGFPVPQNLSGNLHTSTSWFNNGYFFSQPCPSKEVFEENAKAYFEYFKANYDGRFGVANIKAMGVDTDETWYYITQKSELSDYFSDNPSARYTLYYVTDNTLGEDGNIVANSVYMFDVRYEFDTTTDGYLLKFVVESADTSRNGVYTYHYVMK